MYTFDLTDTEAEPSQLKIKGDDPTELYVTEGHIYYYLADGTVWQCDFYGGASQKCDPALLSKAPL